MRALAVVAVAAAGCAASATAGILQRGPAEGMGGSITAHAGIGAVYPDVVVVDVFARGDLADGGSRLAFGASALGGIPIGPSFRLLGRAGVWRAVASSTSEQVTPTFEVAGYIPLRTSPDPKSKFGWGTNGVVVGVREDLDVAAYTTVFVGLELFMIPGY